MPARNLRRRPARRGHEYQDALQYAAGRVDYLKLRLVATTGTQNAQANLRHPSRRAEIPPAAPIVFSLCEVGHQQALALGERRWATSGAPPAISRLRECKKDHKLDADSGFASRFGTYAGPGHWNDPDMLEVGNAHDHHGIPLALPASGAARRAGDAGNDFEEHVPEIKETLPTGK